MKKLLAMTLTGILALSLMVGCTAKTENPPQIDPPKDNGAASQATDKEQDALLPKLVIFNGVSYLMTDDNSAITQEMIGEKIGESSAFIDFAGEVDETLLTKEFANSISKKAVFYKMNGYNDNFRILVEDNGTYFICENTQVSTESILEYKKIVKEATINSHYNAKEYKQLTKDEAVKLIDIFAKTAKAELSATDYETIAQAQVDGKSYQLNFTFEDETTTTFFVIPELNLVSIGQEYYTSDTLNADAAFAFEGLMQEAGEIVS